MASPNPPWLPNGSPHGLFRQSCHQHADSHMCAGLAGDACHSLEPTVRSSMRNAVIVSIARTPIGKAYRGAFNATPAPALGAHAIRAAVERAGVAPAEIDDVVWGAAMQ